MMEIRKRKVAFACFDSDDDEEAFYFKLIDRESLIRVFQALRCQRIMRGFHLSKKEEIYRDGYYNEGWKVVMFDPDYKLISLDDIHRLIEELVFAAGYDLYYIKYNKLINLKWKQVKNL